MNSNDIQKMLAGGKSVDELVAEFTKAVNDYNEQQKKDKVKEEKRNCALTIATALDQYYAKFFPEVAADLDGETDIDEVVELLDNLGDLMRQVKAFDHASFPFKPDKKSSDKDIFTSFFKANNIE